MTTDDRHTYLRPEDRPLGELLGELADETRALMRQELELAKAELKQEATRAGKAGGKLAAGGVTGLVAWLLLSFALVWAIAEALPVWAGFAIVGAVHALVAAMLAGAGRDQLRQVQPTPDRTIAEAEETKRWLQDRR